MKVKGVLTRLKGTFKSHMLARAYLSYKIGMVPVDQLFLQQMPKSLAENQQSCTPKCNGIALRSFSNVPIGFYQ